MKETVDLYGVKDGVEVRLGKILMPPKMKAKEIVHSYFGRIDEDECNDAAMALNVCEELIKWMQDQGWTPPPTEIIEPTRTHDEIIAAQWRNFRDCPKCGADKGAACRTPACVQLQEAPIEVRQK
jgi:hypothetical protein